ncbi:MAG: LysR substrate-binding domain-containing protein, partial [Mangrovicoccus sp.]
ELETYLALKHVVVTSRPAGLGPEDQALSRLGHKRDIAIRCQDLNAAMRLVAGSDMILTMAEKLAQRANIWTNHQILAAPFPAPEIDAYLYWHEDLDADPGNIWLRDMVTKAAAEEPAATLAQS